MTSSRRQADYGVRLNRTVILSGASAESKDLPNYGAPIAIRRQNSMSFRAAQRRGILLIAVWSRFYPALVIDDTIPQSGTPRIFRRGGSGRFPFWPDDPSTSLRVTGCSFSLALNRCTVIGKIPRPFHGL